MTVNPFAQPSTLPYELPPFDHISEDYFRPVFRDGMAHHEQELDAIATNPEPPTWENTIEALERSGAELRRVSAVFFNLLGTDATEELEAIAADIAPQLAAHTDKLYLNEQLYGRITAVTPPDDPESRRLHDHILRQFRRHGAALDAEDKQRLTQLNERLSVLAEQFTHNLREETTRLAVAFERDELQGLDEGRIASAAEDAQALGKTGYVIPLGLPTVQEEQAALELPAARARLYEASLQRGRGANGQVLVEIAQLRAQRAELLGYATHADYVIAEETAATTDAVRTMLFDLSPAAATNARNELKLLVEAAETAGDAEADGAGAGASAVTVTDADRPFWESKVRERDYALDEAELSHYFPLRQVLVDGVFYAAHLLYGITIIPRPDLTGYAADVDVWEVLDEDGAGIGLFLTDYYARPSKRGGAWMSTFVDQSELLGTKPVVVNVLNITKPADGSQPLLSLDTVTTLFHEFGHALHGLLSKVRYPSFSGTNVPRDYVEFPSQINENWAVDPTVLRHYARHVDTQEPIPDTLVNAIHASRQFGQGFATSEYLAAAVIDLAWHSLSAAEAQNLTADDIDAFEQQALAAAGLEVTPRYRSTYFAHVFGGGYAAGYYSYLWAEVLDADGFAWFTEQGAAGPDAEAARMRAAGQRFRDVILSRGAADDYAAAFTALRGRDKDITPLLTRRGLRGALS
ncbi:M3 family metallopeptidase [Corynebacterium matruchotii]|uniref:M3 family metallopeptidase n=1 Tax=Corynebacterium matruchotii TaxID=43768 RepID=UPI0028E75D61|nr:M3 family metallopeptidase [Corynebacterium matruchotii]